MSHHTFECDAPQGLDATVQKVARKGIEVENIRIDGNGPGYSLITMAYILYQVVGRGDRTE